MRAIIRVGGRQYLATPGRYLYLPRLQAEPGSEVVYDDVLLVDAQDGSEVRIGTPKVASVSVRAEVLEHVRGDKDVVFKKKRRKGYALKRGHRQDYTKVRIQSID